MRLPLREVRAALHSIDHAMPYQIVRLDVYFSSVRNTVPIGLESDPADCRLPVRHNAASQLVGIHKSKPSRFKWKMICITACPPFEETQENW